LEILDIFLNSFIELIIAILLNKISKNGFHLDQNVEKKQKEIGDRTI
jgi:hypothetical protein